MTSSRRNIGTLRKRGLACRRISIKSTFLIYQKKIKSTFLQKLRTKNRLEINYQHPKTPKSKSSDWNIRINRWNFAHILVIGEFRQDICYRLSDERYFDHLSKISSIFQLLSVFCRFIGKFPDFLASQHPQEMVNPRQRLKLLKLQIKDSNPIQKTWVQGWLPLEWLHLR